MHWYAENKNIFNKRLKLSVVRSGSQKLSGKEFQAVGPATAKARQLYVLRLGYDAVQPEDVDWLNGDATTETGRQ